MYSILTFNESNQLEVTKNRDVFIVCFEMHGRMGEHAWRHA